MRRTYSRSHAGHRHLIEQKMLPRIKRAVQAACANETTSVHYHQPGYRRKNGRLFYCVSFESNAVNVNELCRQLRSLNPSIFIAKGVNQKDVLVCCYIPYYSFGRRVLLGSLGILACTLFAILLLKMERDYASLLRAGFERLSANLTERSIESPDP